METRYKQPTKKIKKKRLNVARTLVFILVIYIIICFGIFIYNEPVCHYEISGNKYLSDVEILYYLKLKDYPSMISIRPRKLSKKLENNPLVDKATIKYGFNFYIYIDIEENIPLFVNKQTSEIILKDGSKIESDKYRNLPILLNSVPDEILKKFTNKISEVDEGILTMISEIEYAPSYNSQGQIIDDSRFLLYMNDQNLVYLTARRAQLLNQYLDIIATPSIKGTGTLYLDGNEERYSFIYFDKTIIEPIVVEEESVDDAGEGINEN